MLYLLHHKIGQRKQLHSLQVVDTKTNQSQNIYSLKRNKKLLFVTDNRRLLHPDFAVWWGEFCDFFTRILAPWIKKVAASSQRSRAQSTHKHVTKIIILRLLQKQRSIFRCIFSIPAYQQKPLNNQNPVVKWIFGVKGLQRTSNIRHYNKFIKMVLKTHNIVSNQDKNNRI